MNISKYLIISIFCLLLNHPSQAEILIKFQPHEMICGFSRVPNFNSVIKLHRPKPEAEKTIEWLSKAVGIDPNFEFYGAIFEKGQSPRAFAAIRQNKRYIVYDSELLFTSKGNYITWMDLIIMAHELTHHTSGVTAIGAKSKHIGELEADKGAGHLARLLGANLHQTLLHTHHYSEQGSDTHPPKKQRQQAIIKGWNTANLLLQAIQ